jgi:ABC-type cobalamin/Fe3+-siderophores transport system ATPase subunit
MDSNLIFIKKFLKASLEDLVLLGKDKYENIYDNHLHTDSDKAQKLFQEIKNKIENQETQTFVIKGYKGCGKTTFAYFLKKELPYRSYILPFDYHVDPILHIRGPLIKYIIQKTEEKIVCVAMLTSEHPSVASKGDIL